MKLLAVGGTPFLVLVILMALLFASICLVYAALKSYKRSRVGAVLLVALAVIPWLYLVIRATLFLIHADQLP